MNETIGHQLLNNSKEEITYIGQDWKIKSEDTVIELMLSRDETVRSLPETFYRRVLVYTPSDDRRSITSEGKNIYCALGADMNPETASEYILSCLHSTNPEVKAMSGEIKG